MAAAPDTAVLVAAILNAGWMVRNYALQRNAGERLRRHQAIRKMGLEVREAFTSSDDYEALLGAVVDALRPQEGAKF